MFENFNFSAARRKRQATVTIILVTAIYIAFNVPLFANFVLYIITITRHEYPGPLYEGTVMFFYSWNVTAILCTVLNSTLNPLIYLTRIKRFRVWIKTGARGRMQTLTRNDTCYDDTMQPRGYTLPLGALCPDTYENGRVLHRTPSLRVMEVSIVAAEESSTVDSSPC